MSKERLHGLSLATLGEWALFTYGALLLVQIALAFILLVLFVWTFPTTLTD